MNSRHFNSRFLATAGAGSAPDVLVAVAPFAAMPGSAPKAGATCGLIYLPGFIAIGFAPDTTDRKLDA